MKTLPPDARVTKRLDEMQWRAKKLKQAMVDSNCFTDMTHDDKIHLVSEFCGELFRVEKSESHDNPLVSVRRLKALCVVYIEIQGT